METWFDIQGCAFWSHKDSEWAVTLLIQLSPFHIAIHTTKTVDAQFISHYAFQSGNRSSSGEILQTHRDKAAPCGS